MIEIDLPTTIVGMIYPTRMRIGAFFDGIAEHFVSFLLVALFILKMQRTANWNNWFLHYLSPLIQVMNETWLYNFHSRASPSK
jgi:hypothetical protein